MGQADDSDNVGGSFGSLATAFDSLTFGRGLENELETKIRVEDVLAAALEKAYGRKPEIEYQFHPTRRWRFDIAFVDQRLAVEVDGKFHASLSANRKDAEKHNAALEAGWRVLRYPASAVLTKKRLPRIVEQIGRVLCGTHDPESAGCVLVGD